MNKRHVVVTRSLKFDEDFKPTVEQGIYTALIEDFPKNGRILEVSINPAAITIAIEAEVNEKGILFTEERDIIMVPDDVKFSKTPEFDTFISEKEAKLHKEGCVTSSILIHPVRDEYEFIKWDVIYRKSFYIHSYRFSQFDLHTL